MDPIEALGNADLLQFFHSHKTEMACMEKPLTFLTQLRDHDLLPEDSYRKMSRMKSKDRLKKAVYEFLDWLEVNQPQLISTFWRAAFVELLMNQYHTLRKLHYSLMDGPGSNQSLTSFHIENEVESEARDGRLKALSGSEENKETNATPAKRKRRKLKGSKCEEDEDKQTKASCGETPGQRRKSRKLTYYSPLKKGEKTEIWRWPIYKVQLPVRCGEKKGLLDRKRMAKGLKCIMVSGQWFSPTEFERFAGKQRCKNWKLTIQCMGTPLGKLIQEGHLKSTRFRGRTVKARKSLFRILSDDEDESGGEKSNADEQPSTSGDPESSSTEGELNEQAEQEPEGSPDVCNTVFKVACGISFGALHKKRFASGTCGKCIRTATSWMTPIEFVEASLGQTNTSWRRDIRWEGKPLAYLIKDKILRIHFLKCNCPLCNPSDDDLENERNDDECWVCKSDEDRLVLCDKCPRSFHKTCHLPYVEDADCGDRGQWLCTFCVYKSNEECFYQEEQSREEAMSLQLSQHLLECHYLLLRLSSAEELPEAPRSSASPDESAVFTELRRMLGIIAEKLQFRFYETVGQFVSEVELIFTNSASPHQADELIATGNRLKKVFDEDFKNVFHIVG
eukprot:XP_011602012.1 PREDICTED: nuclear body protein SP140-like protein isoform X1 [Takifugu rubripes]